MYVSVINSVELIIEKVLNPYRLGYFQSLRR